MASWTARAVLLLALALCVQVGLSHFIARQAADYTGRGWVNAGHTRQVPHVLAAELEHSRGIAEQLVDSPELVTSVQRKDAASLMRQLGPRFGNDIRWWVSEDGGVPLASNAPTCPLVLPVDPPGDLPTVVVCDGVPMVLGVVRSGPHPITLVHGVPLGDDFVNDLRRTVGTETFLRVDDLGVVSSFRRPDGTPMAVDTIELPFVATRDVTFDEVELVLSDYGGYLDPLNGSVYNRDRQKTAWYLGTRTLDQDGRVELALLAPVEVLQQGPIYALVALALGSMVVLILLGIVIHVIVQRYRGPLVQLSASAYHVAQGEFSRTVAVPRGHDMADFCATYNEMLGRLDHLVTTRSRLAREAGMAEIAAGVLHNVGNSMTTVGAGLELAREQLATLPIARFERLADLLERHQDDLTTFFGPGGRGHRTVAFLRAAANHLSEHAATLTEELQIVAVATEHTMQIVRAQQRYTGAASCTTRCTVEDVVEDAIRIAAVEGDIEVVRRFETFSAEVDRHRVIQILVNLLTNARDALREVSHEDRRIWVTLADRGATFSVRVADNGPGIPAEAHNEIFRAGYTTKPDGHGFGLHASFNAAVEMGGTLNVESPANAAGAVFEVVLPTQEAAHEAVANG